MTRRRATGSTHRVRAAAAGVGVGAVLWWGGQAVVDGAVAYADPVGTGTTTTGESTSGSTDSTASGEASSGESGASAPAGSSAGDNGSGAAESPATESSGPDPVTPDPVTPEQSGAEPSRTETATPETATPEADTTEIANTESASAPPSVGTQPHSGVGAQPSGVPATPVGDSATGPDDEGSTSPGASSPETRQAPTTPTPTSPMAVLMSVSTTAAPVTVVGSAPAPATVDDGVPVVNAPTKFVATLLSVLGFNPFAVGNGSAPPPQPALVFAWAAWQQINRRLFNSYPVLTPGGQTVGAGGVVTGSLGASDPDRDTVTYTVTDGPDHGTVVIGPDGTYAYTPDPDYAHQLTENGGTTTAVDSFTVTVSDETPSNGWHLHWLSATGASGQTATVTVTVAPANAAPTITATAAPDGASTVYTVVTADPDGDTTTVAASAPAHGTIVDNGDGTWTYTPDPAYAHGLSAGGNTTPGSDSVTFTVTDGHGGSVTTVVTPLIAPTNAAPVLVVSGSSGSSAVIVLGNAQTSLPNGVTVSADGKYAFVGDTTAGAVYILDADPSSATFGQILGQIPVANATGAVATPDGSTLYVADMSQSGGVVVIGVDPEYPGTGTVIGTIPLGNLPGDLAMSPDGNTLYVATNTGVRAIDIGSGSTAGDVVATYLPGSSLTGVLVGADNKTLYATGGSLVRVIDIDPDSATYQQVLFTIATPAATGVAASPDGRTLYVSEQNARVVAVIDIDPSSPTYRQVIATLPAGGTPTDVALTPDGTRLYVTGLDGTVRVIPTGGMTGTASATDADAGDTPSYSVTTGPAHGTVTLNPTTGGWVYTPNPGAVLTQDSFVISVDDGHGGHDAVTVTTNGAPTITVTPAPDGASTVYTVVTADPDGDTTTITVSAPAHGTMVDNNDGTWTYTPDPGYAHGLSAGGNTTPGADSVTFTVTDGRGGVTTTTITPVIAPANLAPQGSVLVTSDHGSTTSTIGSGTTRLWEGVASPDGKRLYASVQSGSVVIVDADVASATYGQILKTVNVGQQTAGITVSPDGTWVYVVAGNSLRIIDVDPASSTYGTLVTTTYQVPNGAQDVVVSPEGKRAYVVGSTMLYVVNVDPTSVTYGQYAAYTFADGGDLAISADGTHVYVAGYNGSEVSTVTVSPTSSGYIPPSNVRDTGTGANPSGLALSADGTRLYSSNVGSGTVTILDVDPSTTPQAIGTITMPTGASPSAVALGADGRTLLVSDQLAALVYIVDVDPNSAHYKQVVSSVPTSGPNGSLIANADGSAVYAIGSGSTSAITVIPLSTSGTVIGTDADNDAVGYTLSTGPSGGSVTLNSATGAWTYVTRTPGTIDDTFVVTVCDGHGGATPVTVTVGAAASSTLT
ncbi:Ig-like domain-containing protein [Gordonia sp. N1V]|uniref:Ig-like domain-containing protein n=1 Tax=Gordonia sp. N1V TaxID=3034163 RepID=UPI0023E146E5|nr:Ig-like domain-containing protein [Gordonia sp. N1V]MDF3280952.1 Ig-like domain-containing protein [Gordonia sp. N1V]